MSDLLEKQGRLQHSIERSLSNFKKIGKANLVPATIRSRIASLQTSWTQFQEGHDHIASTIPAKSRASVAYFQEGQYESVEEAFQTTLDYMTVCLEEKEPVVSPNQSLLDASVSRSEAAAISLSHLPPIKLPPFDGNYSEWESFRDRFTTLILTNKSLSDFSRMHYLASSLKGRALDSINHISVTAENFSVAWAALTRRFESKRRLLSHHFASLLALSDVSKESPAELQALFDKISITVASLGKLDRTPSDLWDDLLVHLLTQKVDPATRKAWNLKTSDADAPSTFKDFSSFLLNRIRALETSAPAQTSKSARDSKAVGQARVSASTATTDSHPVCPLCKARHYVNSCSKFAAQTPAQRRETIKQLKRCFNCFSNSHSVLECKSRFSCRSCGKKHHSMLHSESEPEPLAAVSPAKETPPQATAVTASAVTSLSASKCARTRSQILLATALVKIESTAGRSVVVRAMIDQGSEVTFISESLAQTLRLRRFRMPTQISGVGCVPAGIARQGAEIKISPVTPSSQIVFATALVLPSLTSYAPRRLADQASLAHLYSLAWADPDPTGPDPIQLLLGADCYRDIILEGVRKGAPGLPIAQNTIFGWIISGPVPERGARSTVSVHHCTSLMSLSADIQKFWETEEIPSAPARSPLDEQCEAHFRDSHSRESSGRYVVRLPFKVNPPLEIGNSERSAERLLSSLVRRLDANPDLRRDYYSFMSEYESLGHMRRVAFNHVALHPPVFIPHHPVIRANSATTKLRVVFNASHATTNGSTLNSHLLIGPKLQPELPSIVAQWRQFKYVYTADIAKMYRQIRLDSRDLDFQRIKWRPDASEVSVDYQLLTVTYGMACAPFLALRVLKQLAEDEGARFPLAAQVLNSHVYVDDVLFGADRVDALRALRDQLTSLLRCGGFELRKWASNSTELLSDIDPADHGLACSKSLADDDHVKVLGVIWNPARDSFQFLVSLESIAPTTKRSILSVIARLYDPLGWVTPAIIAAKIIMQELWLSGVGWDDSIPDAIRTRWLNLYTRLPHLNKLLLPRWTGADPHSDSELHGFADASSHAYAAVIYLRTISPAGDVSISLIAGKSRVAPLSTLTIPRLELSAALLLSRLFKFVRDSLHLTSVPCVAWTDSTVALAWIRSHPSRWTTFVANRVAKIHLLAYDAVWRHVPTATNPADCASRGLSSDDLIAHRLWWEGPPWLMCNSDEWPVEPESISVDSPGEENRRSHHVIVPPAPWDLSTRYSSWPKLIRVTAYLYRFILSCKRRARTSSPPPVGSALSSTEFTLARLFWLKEIQRESFPDEISALQSGRNLSVKNSIVSLSPFIDNDGLLRVGGRLRLAPMPYETRHPILLKSHSLVRLLASHAHLKALHGGTQLTLSILRKTYWILRARNIVKSIIHSCLPCVRERAAVPTQLMGNLPAVRVSPPSRCFAHCGLDYAGPLKVRASAGRGIKSIKAYIALFICLASRAVHIELVGDYTTHAFLQAFKRFCSRRGLPQSIYSDNGTTFVGADRELAAAYRAALRDPELLNSTGGDRIEWHFIPPSAPHFGGIWEAGVKCIKHHVRRVLGDRTLSFEELSTLLCEIEACLNSRPIAPLSDDFLDFQFLTPGHFLVGASLAVPPEPSLLDLQENRLSRWQMVRQIAERFWRLWSSDYINTLQQRGKWRKPQSPLTVGRLVLLRNPLLPPCKWELGRVTRVHPGPDDLPRVATIKTAASEFVRPIGKLCLLPISELDAQNDQAGIVPPS